MATSVYIGSSIISYLTARPSRDLVVAARQTITADWWVRHRRNYEAYISALVEEEISAGDEAAANQRLQAVTGIASVAITQQAQELATKLIAEKAASVAS